MTRNIALGLVISVLSFLGCQAATAASVLKLSGGADLTSFPLAENAAKASAISDVVLFRNQSFRVLLDDQIIGDLVLGQGQAASSEGRQASICFVAFRPTNQPAQLLRTVGAGSWEAESCQGVNAVGLTGQPVRIAILYGASSPNTDTVEPVIISYGAVSKTFRIDAEATRRVTDAGATSLARIRAALKPK